MKHNPTNAVSHLGHSNGVVSLWSPASGKALVSMFCHKAPVTDLAIDREGRYMATTGMDGYLKLWDLRKFGNLHCYKLDHPGVSVDISDRGLIAVALGRSAHVLSHAFTQPQDTTYIKHTIRCPSTAFSSGGSSVTSSVHALASSIQATSVKFRPLEDVLCISHSHGLSTIVVPGSGEPNFDSFENNPFMNPKQRREAEVQSLLYKISHEMIGLDSSFVGSVDKDQNKLIEEHKQIFTNANQNELKKKEKNKKRGRNKISAKIRRKQKNVIDSNLIKLKENQKKNKQEKLEFYGSGGGSDILKESSKTKKEKVGDALQRFAKKVES